ncbi:hypothetical protein [Flavobacterium sp. LC2016-01]|uniref:hypothetical protein n=1 Tax=Flavobacterium sp. LC2016-01 TaxID=2675876 RepID=UPI0012BAB8D4|nr:hypothetical protein [Flavobacterium sp. LC2016-01]MTH14201.1 hypothetical protein [Flavobacterium sp. LC2016-01]
MKKYIALASTIIVFIITQSCSQKKENADAKLKDYCSIIFESKRKNIYVTYDDAFSEEWIKQKNGKDKKIQKKLNFTKKELDSLAKYAYQIIKAPALATTHLTCGAGENITIEISYCNTSILCKYSSIQSWSTLSNDNKKLYDLLSSKTIIPK